MNRRATLVLIFLAFAAAVAYGMVVIQGGFSATDRSSRFETVMARTVRVTFDKTRDHAITISTLRSGRRCFGEGESNEDAHFDWSDRVGFMLGPPGRFDSPTADFWPYFV